MISSWLIKMVLGIALVGLAVIELGSPLVAKAQLDSAAHDVADAVALRIDRLQSRRQFEEFCDEEARKRSIEIVACGVTGRGDERVVTVDARKQATSFVLDRVGATKDWYDQRITVTADVN